MLPIVIRSTEEMLRLVPDELRHGSYALGNRKWRTILTVVLPAALRRHRQSGVMLAVARAAGETAPLLFTIGAARAVNSNLFDGPTTALSVQIFRNAQQPFPAVQDRAWAAALTLVVIVFVFTVARPNRVGPRRSRSRHARLIRSPPCSTSPPSTAACPMTPTNRAHRCPPMPPLTIRRRTADTDGRRRRPCATPRRPADPAPTPRSSST